MSNNPVHFESRNATLVVDLIGQPAFLLDVEGPGKFRFAHLNKHHSRESGADASMLIGRTPHDVLPHRIADTVVANYERCRMLGRVISYEEELKLSDSTRWWQTTLSPIPGESSGAEVRQILGTALDITTLKSHGIELTKELSMQIAASESIRSFASNAMLDSEGPMRAVLSWLEVLREGFVDLGDGKFEEMNRVQELAIDAVVGMDDVLHSERFRSLGSREGTAIDLGHMCRDIAALVDPNCRIKMELPSEQIEGEWAVAQIVLRILIEQATKTAASRLSVSVEQAPSKMLAFTLKYDADNSAGLKDQSEHMLIVANILKERGGELSISPKANEGVTIEAIWPGLVLKDVQQKGRSASA